MIAIRVGAAALFALAMLAVSGCASSQETASEDATSGAVPEFTGPYAAEFADHYSLSKDDFVRSILEDGVVSEQENAEVLDRFFQCVKTKGYTISNYQLDGSYKVDFSNDIDADKAGDDVLACSRSSGEAYVASLYSWTHRNPNRENESEIVASCLVKSGAVPSFYTALNYDEDSKSDRFPFEDQSSGRKKLDACRVDPLGAEQ